MGEPPAPALTVTLDLRDLTAYLENLDDQLVLVLEDGNTTVVLSPGLSIASLEAARGAEACASNAGMLAEAIKTAVAWKGVRRPAAGAAYPATVTSGSTPDHPA